VPDSRDDRGPSTEERIEHPVPLVGH
jgi:hypothetical protein